MTRTRRDVLSGIGPILGIALAGCLSGRPDQTKTTPMSAHTTEPPTTSETVTRTTPPTPDHGWTKLKLTPTTPREIVERAVRPRSSFDPDQQTLLEQLTNEGSVTIQDITRHSDLPLHPPYLVEFGGSVYLVTKQIIDSRDVTVHRFRIEVIDDSRADARAFADLSKLDQAIVEQGIPEEYREHGTPFTGTFHYPFENQSPMNSWIVATDGDVFVTYEDDTLRLRSKGSDTTVEQDVRYDLREVAGSRSAAREYVVSKYVQPISTEELPRAQREIFTAAIDRSEGYKEERQGSKSFRAVLDRLEDAPQVPNAGRYIRYKGTIYQVEQTGVEV